MKRSFWNPSRAADRGEPPRRGPLVAALGFNQIISWGSSFYLLTVLAKPIVAETGWSLPWVVGGLSLGLLAGGAASPRVGRTIEHRGGRLILSCSSILFAAGLGGLALSTSLAAYLAAWFMVGIAMGCGLYDATFSVLGRIYVHEARRAITILTLFGGFASTLCWPLTAYLCAQWGWRGACLAYAGVHLFACLPLNLLVLPHGVRPLPSRSSPGEAEALPAGGATGRKRTVEIGLLATIFTLNAGLVTVISIHLISILQARGMGLAAAVGLAALFGPAQVGARLGELVFGRFYHPLWTLVASTSLAATGLALLRFEVLAAGVALVIYGAGVGLGSITRGTVPLRLFGPLGYASLMGRLAMPCLLAQALSPSLASFLLAGGDPNLTLSIVMAMAITNVVLVLLLRTIAGPSR